MHTSIRPTRALMRSPSPRFNDALVHGAREEVDLLALMAQHREIAAGLGRCGLDVTVLEPLEDAPDACFVEDRAVVLGGEVLITRSAVPSRAVEADSVAEALSAHLELVPMERGTLDGGDVLRVGKELWVGKSRRSNQAGAEVLGAFARRHGLALRVIDVQGLHLKCVCSCPAPGLLLYAEGFGLEPFAGAASDAIAVPEREAYAANAVGHGGVVLVAEGYPVTAERLAAAGLRVEHMANSEFAKRDGSLTCLSVLY